MAEYRSNSHKSREEISNPSSEKKIEKVISGSAKSKKKGGIQKLANIFIADDVDDVKSYIFEDIVVPAVKDIILDAVKAVLGVNNTYKGRSSTAGKISYRKYYDDRDRRDRDTPSQIKRAYDYDDMLEMCEEDEKLKLPLVVAGQRRSVNFVTENGLYNILAQSRMEIARSWRRVVHDELINMRKEKGRNIAEQFEEWDHASSYRAV